jgi:hypothetical protein
MTDNEIQKAFTEKLISQDAGISPTSLQEQRMKIESTVESLYEKARSSQRFTIRAIAALAVCYLFGFAFNAAGPWLPYTNVIAPIWSLCTWTAIITAAVAVIRYWTIHRPQLEKGRVDLQVAMFQELQCQISELQRRQ